MIIIVVIGLYRISDHFSANQNHFEFCFYLPGCSLSQPSVSPDSERAPPLFHCQCNTEIKYEKTRCGTGHFGTPPEIISQFVSEVFLIAFASSSQNCSLIQVVISYSACQNVGCLGLKVLSKPSVSHQ